MIKKAKRKWHTYPNKKGAAVHYKMRPFNKTVFITRDDGSKEITTAGWVSMIAVALASISIYAILFGPASPFRLF